LAGRRCPASRTLRGAIDWSYDLLGARERWLFDTLGVFAGEFDLGTVGAIAGLDEFEALDLIEQLVAKSMAESDPSRDRYRLLRRCASTPWTASWLSGGWPKPAMLTRPASPDWRATRRSVRAKGANRSPPSRGWRPITTTYGPRWPG
jgi:hypothetical protein